jgi:hypothetical protein
MTMPSEQIYGRFLEALRQNVRIFNTAEDDGQRLASALALLQGVVIYLQQDRDVLDEQLTRPLGWLESIVNDARRGAEVAALKPIEPASGRPTGLARERVQAASAFGLELLVMAAKVPLNEAAQFIVTTARKHLVSESGDELADHRVA